MKSKTCNNVQPKKHPAYSQKSKQLALMGMLLGVMLTGSAFAQSNSAFEVRNEKNKKFPAAEAARIYDSVCVVVAREVRPEHPPQLQPRFKLVLGSDRDELAQHNEVVELHLRSWDRDKFAQAVVILAAREILKNDAVSKLSRRALAWTDAVVPMNELAEAK